MRSHRAVSTRAAYPHLSPGPGPQSRSSLSPPHMLSVLSPFSVLHAKGRSRTVRQPKVTMQSSRGTGGPGATSSGRCQDPGEGLL